MSENDAFEIRCPKCHRSIKAYDKFVGKQVNCPGCKAPFVVQRPAPEEDDYHLADIGLDAPAQSDSFPPEPMDTRETPWRPSPNIYGAPPRPEPPSHLPEARRYPALTIVRIILLIQAALVAAGWLIMVVIAIIGMMFADSDSFAVLAGGSMVYIATTLIGVAITCCMLVAAAELIKVILDIQENTLAAARR